MNGLLNPRTMGLLGAAQGLLQSGGASRLPVGLGQAAGMGLQGGLIGYQQGLHMQAMQQQQQAQAQQQEALRRFGETVPPDQRDRFFADPAAYLKATSPKTPEPFTLPAGGIRYDPTGKIIAQAPTKPGEPSALAKLIEEQKKFPPGSPIHQIYQQAIERQTTHAPAPTITNTINPSTPGQKAADTKFAEDFVQFATGGFADTQKQIGQLQEVSNALEAASKGSGSLTGPLVGSLPESLRAMVNPKSQAAQDAVEEVVQRNLRLILGAQFTEKEGARLIARAYNPRLNEAENKRRVDRLIQQIRQAAEAKLDASRYFMAHGSLQGWKGKLWTMSDFEPDVASPAGSQDDPLGIRGKK